ncbi:metallophosphoesterase family protein [Candidatus Micrarchaeota archaeon]|jgi:hypothetical protein|nr:metallophosphoesterase family protein [Candidatus Micrarchaeota archaeon]
MKILALADLHSEERLLEIINMHLKNNIYDMIILSGDITNFGPESYVKDLLNTLKNQKVFAVLGNCDPIEIKTLLKNKNVEGKCKKFDKYNILGIGGAVRYNTTFTKQPGAKTEDEFEKEISKLDINENTIFISHSPPFQILDNTNEGFNVGSKALKKMIETKQPLLFICGHVHEECNFKKIRNTTIVNLPPAKELKAGIILINPQNNNIDIKFIKL